VIGRHSFGTPGPTLEFDGHLDVIDIPNPAPHFAEGRFYGRGACDMKGPLACMVEAARILVAGAPELAGALMITAHSRHETPVGRNEPLEDMIERGQFGDAVIIGECGFRTLPIKGRGMSAYRVTLERQGDVLHETKGPHLPDPVLYMGPVISALAAEAKRLAHRKDAPFETVFIGQVHGGDFYNRIPRSCWLEGTWRHEMPKRPAEIQAGLERLLAFTWAYAAEGITTRIEVIPGPDAFCLSPEEDIACCLKAAYRTVHGAPLEEELITLCGNAPWFIRDAHVPCLYHGLDQASAHSDNEHADLEEMLDLVRTYIMTALLYLAVE
jgi:acetylornithine deacetylase/succinyl-diaminopimelate desuccinylase-like protein